MTLKHSMKTERKTKRDQNNMIKQNKILQYIHDFGASSKIDGMVNAVTESVFVASCYLKMLNEVSK